MPPIHDRGVDPQAFREKLLARIRSHALSEGVAAQRLQQRIAFERLLARLSSSGDWVLKGGFAIEMRYGWRARVTKDLDLRSVKDTQGALADLRRVVAERGPADSDQFTFELGTVVADLQGAPGGGLRVRVTCRLAGEVFSQFHVDLSSRDALVGEPEMMTGSDLLAFAGIAPIRFPVYPIAQQLAEKLHAYTLPRTQENTRAKDFVDLVLVSMTESVSGDRLHDSLSATFDIRKTHQIPSELPKPPRTWAAALAKLAPNDVGATIGGLDESYRLAVDFWGPVLESDVRGSVWIPATRRWDPSSGAGGVGGGREAGRVGEKP